MYKLVVFDCDGTLLTDDQRVTDRTRNAVQGIMKKALK